MLKVETEIEEIKEIKKKEWIAFLEVRQDGQHNMWSRHAIDESGLGKDKWFKIMKNFDELHNYWGGLK